MSKLNGHINEAALPAYSNSPIDNTGDARLRPTAWRGRLFVVVFVALIALGVFLYLQGLFSIGIALITVCLAGLAILTIVARSATKRIFGRQHEHYSASALGKYLAADAQEIKQQTPTLTDEEVAAIDLHRATEAVLVNEWVVNARTPRRIQVRSDDGTSLVGRMVPGTKRERPWVLMLHGFGGTWRDSLAFSRIYAAHDCNIMFVDMRAHGESEGEWAGMGWLDRRDVIAWCSWITARTGEEAQIIIHGLGMGATAALFAAAENDFPAQVRAIVADSAYTDTWNEAVQRMGKRSAKPQPFLDLYRATLKKASGGYDLAVPNVLPLMQGNPVPKLIMQGEQDTATPPYMGVYLAMAAGCDVQAIVEAIAAKETMADIAGIKASVAQELASKQQKQAQNSTSEEPSPATTESESAEQAKSDTEPAESATEECADKLSEPEQQPEESIQNQPTEKLNSIEFCEIELENDDTTANEEADEGCESEASDQTDEEQAEESTTEEYPEDDLSDLFYDKEDFEEADAPQEALPHIARSSTGNVFLFASGAGHCQTAFACPTAYENTLNEFLNRCIG